MILTGVNLYDYFIQLLLVSSNPSTAAALSISQSKIIFQETVILHSDKGEFMLDTDILNVQNFTQPDLRLKKFTPKRA